MPSSQGAPGIFIQKLAELTEWQRQQQEKLLREQETQRQILSNEQQRMCDVYGLEPTGSKERRPTRSLEDTGSHVVEGKPGVSHARLDEIPLPSQNKNFDEFLREKLREDASVPRPRAGDKPKRPFLRKGQGLARFRLNPDGRPKRAALRKPANRSAASDDPGRKGSGGSENVENDRHWREESRNDAPSWTHFESQPSVPTWSHVLSQTQPSRVPGEVSTEKKKREMEELRVFELLEQKAANSSFCSTSSVIAQLMSKSVQSTPIKPRPPQPDASLHVRFADSRGYQQYQHPPGQAGEGGDRSVGGGLPGGDGTKVPRDFRDSRAWSDDDSCDSQSQSSGSSSSSGANNDDTLTGRRSTDSHEEKRSSPRQDSVPDVSSQPWHEPRTCLEREHNVPESWHEPKPSINVKSDASQPWHEPIPSTNLKSDASQPWHELRSSTKVKSDASQPWHEPIPSTNLKSDASQPWHELRSSTNVKSHASQPWHEPRTSLEREHNVPESWHEPIPPINVKSDASQPCNEPSTPVDREPDVPSSETFLFKSSLLRTRLQELENEIETFRRENAALSKLRRSHELEASTFRKERKEAERKLEEERESARTYLETEKKKLAKERMVHERHAKQLRDRPSRGEREEIALLRVRTEGLREELANKDGRWAATQARTRDRLRQLESENCQLKATVRELKRERQEARQSRVGTSKVSNTKVIHAINNHIGKIKPREQLKNSFVIKNVVPSRPIPRSVLSQRVASKAKPGIAGSLRRIQSVPDMGVASSPDDGPSDKEEDDSSTADQSGTDSETEATRSAVGARLERMRDVLYDTLHGSPPGEGGTVRENGNREKVYADGRRETWYPNGNVKKVSADRSLVKMIYFNGDVKETLTGENLVKYYYAETRTWHTTHPDGSETLEFPNGQVERRSADGSTEITFSNGCVRLCLVDGRDEWSFPDGTVVKTTTAGEKVVKLSNGQREVHTLEHKRREYPDGTVKLVYPDGLQETRYANGRIRLRDKDGTLILDSAAEN